ncbi:MAG: AI-2E family transporter [Gemmatimonadota bacterium]|jgi:predicted PurR-regulated permease PerM
MEDRAQAERDEQSRSRLQRGFLLVIVVGITILLLAMIRSFLVALILAAVFAAMGRPAFLALEEWLRGRRRLAALLTVLGLLVLIVVPVAGFLTLVVTQAVEVSDTAGSWISQQTGRLEELTTWLHGLPFVGQFMPDQEALASRASDFVGRAGTFIVNNLRTATAGTVSAMLQLFVMLYALYFFLIDGPGILSRILYFTPLEEHDERKLAQQFVSVTRATIKGSIVIGLIQGALAGAAFFVLGIPGAAFWSTIMAVLSVIPVLGSGIVWAPTALILVVTGRAAAGIGLAVWGFAVVGLVDNFMRPRMVGRDTKMHDLLVLLSTFGGLAMFGLLGFIVGPIVAAVFMTAWDLYGAAFKGVLPEAPKLSETETPVLAGPEEEGNQGDGTTGDSTDATPRGVGG